MFSPDIKKYSRRGFIGLGFGAAAALFLPNSLENSNAQTFQKPYVIALHGYNGTTTGGFIGNLAAYLDLMNIPYETPLLPGGMNPDRDEWEGIIISRIKKVRQEYPTVKLVPYSLSVVAALGALSNEGVEVDSLATISGRKIHPALPLDFPSNLERFYGGGVNAEKVIKNTHTNILVVHSEDDGVVWFENNAKQLAEQLRAKTLFVNGMGHFDQPVSKGMFELQARKIVMS